MAQQQSNAGQGGGNNVPLIRPQQLDNLPLSVSAEQRQSYKNILTQLYQQYENSPAGSPQHVEAEGKIRQATMRIMQQISGRGGNNRPQSGGGPGQAPGGQQQQRPQQAPGQQQQGQQGQQGQQAAMAQNMQQQGSSQGQQGQQQGNSQLSPQGQADLQTIRQINIPPQVLQQGEAQVNQYRQQFRQRAVQALLRRDAAKVKGSNLQRQQHQNGQQQIPNLQQQLQNIKSEMEAAHNEFKKLQHQNAQYGGQGGNQQPQVNGVNSMMQRTNSSQGVNQAQQEQGDVKMNMDQQQARTSMSPTQQQQASFPQNQNQNQGAPSSAQQQQNMQQPPITHPQQQTPQTATQGQLPQGFPQQNNMMQQQNQQQRPSITQQMNQQMAQQQNMPQPQQQQQQQQNTPTQGMPPQQQQQAGQPPQPQRPQIPQALSHQAAMSQASSARQDAAAQQQQQQQNQPQQGQLPNMPNSLPFNAPPSATNQTPTSGYPQQQLPQQASSSTKFPIPKQLQLDPRTQGPVQGPPSRPTFSNAGMMGQPGIQRAAQFTLEGEGDRVLSKSKLHELVRQVSRTTADSSSTSSDGAGGLAPDVEESVLDLADDFVDNVIMAACRLAKLRSSQSLDLRDIQIVLERNYGIRIPGFGLDEVRTVRKFQPAEGWRSKMQAVQAGKVMGGSGGRDT